MVRVLIEDIKSGMVLGRSIYSGAGDLLLAAGFKLQDKYVHRLKTLGYSDIWIQKEGTENVIPDDLINEQLALQTNKALRESADVIRQTAKVKTETKEDIDNMMKDSSRFKNIIAEKKIKSSIDSILESLLGQQDLLINVNSIRNKDDYLYRHNLDVTIMSILLGNRLKLNKIELTELAFGAILHDLGMVVIPDSIQNKGSRLNFQEFTILKEHTSYGYNILRENPRISPVSAHIAYQHHERQDGGGFPRGLKGDNGLPGKKRLNQPMGFMHRYAEIVAVADTYDNLVSPKNPSDAKSPDEALRILIRSAGTQLNKHVVDSLITITPAYPVGALVAIVEGPKELLGYRGVVSKNSSANLESPEVILLYSKRNKRIKPFVLDLSVAKMVKIQFLMKN